MMMGFNAATSGMMIREAEIAVLANNLANADSNGFQAFRLNSSDLPYHNLLRPGDTLNDNGNLASGIQLGMGAKISNTYRIQTAGEPINTGSDFDLYVNGSGFFKVEMPDGTYSYTRDGSFGLNDQGQLVTSQGLIISPGIIIPQNTQKVTINKSGQVTYTISGSPTPVVAGTLDIATFANPAGLIAIGDNLLTESPNSGPETVGQADTNGVGSLMQGFVEHSNVNPVSELTTMVTAQRGYELCSKVLKASDDMMEAAIRITS